MFAAEHVPGLELRLAKALGVALRAWPVVASNHMNGRIDLNETRPRIDRANRLHRGDGGPHQLVLELSRGRAPWVEVGPSPPAQAQKEISLSGA